MPIRLKDLQSATRKIQLDFHGETLEVEYWVNKVTPALYREMQSWKDDESLQKGVCTIVKRWDLLDEKDQEIPLELEQVELLPNELLREVQKAVLDDMSGGAESKNG